MENTIQREVEVLRDLRELNIAKKELEVQHSLISRKIKRGIKLLDKEILSVEGEIDAGIFIDGTESRNTRSPELKRLVSDPCLETIPEDNDV